MATKNPLVIAHPGDYGHGWKQGYRCVAEGGAGQPPTIPPNQYWSASYQSEKGRHAVDEWYRGFHEGALSAEKCGVGRYHYLRATEPLEHAEHVVSHSTVVAPGPVPTIAPVNEAIVAPPVAAKVTPLPPAPVLQPLPPRPQPLPAPTPAPIPTPSVMPLPTLKAPVPNLPPVPAPNAPSAPSLPPAPSVPSAPNVPPAPTIINPPQTNAAPQLGPPRATQPAAPALEPNRDAATKGPLIQPLPPRPLPAVQLPRRAPFDPPPVVRSGAVNNDTASRNPATY